MRIPDNRVATIVSFFQKELQGLFEPEEIRIMTFLCFEAFLGYKSPSDLILHASEHVNQSDLLRLNFAVKDLKAHRPVQYITGQTEFYHCPIKVNPHVLIPRPETEELVDRIIREQQGKSISLLDIGTGSGCIAIALKKNLSQAEVWALDISEAALQLAAANANLNKVSITFQKRDICYDQKQWTGPALDCIVSNPPYIRHSEKEEMARNVTDYEPHLALFVDGDDPLLFYRHILAFGRLQLRSGGRLYLEINEAFGAEVKELLFSAGYSSSELHPDMNGKPRMISATWNGKAV
ncbi:MAG TPA: peptide chain release factor N(5)-glutamine methyltransferase [Bacteroidia bacterium]|jgi:release factor glutamine methyltransferase|nr:peptide chain release factor N(5)-glutamine methyltransferase [Bacteroidia bacterium]